MLARSNTPTVCRFLNRNAVGLTTGIFKRGAHLDSARPRLDRPRVTFPKLRAADAKAALAVLSRGLLHAWRPILVQIVITQRCNLDCGYCNEYDKVSAPVPAAMMRARIDELARLKTAIVTLTGGEPFLHPDLVGLVAYVKERGMLPLLITNGYLMTAETIRALGEAGLYGLQISIDNIRPNETSKKSLKVLLPKLRVLAENATFQVRLNSVLGSGPPEEAIEVTQTALDLGFDSACAILHDHGGQLVPLDARARLVYARVQGMIRRTPFHLNDDFQLELLDRGALDWKCRAGARYLYVCEEGLVHLCSQQRGYPGTRLADYTDDDCRREFYSPKSCARTCTLPCVHHASSMDRYRSQDPARAAS